MSDDPRRTLRVAGLLRAHLTDALRRELGDSELAAIVVTGIEVTRDLSVAHVRVRRLADKDDEQARASVLDRLRRAAPRLRRALGPRLELRRVPELRFVYDTGQDAAERVQALLGEIAEEPKGS